MRDREIARKNQELSMLERSIRNMCSKDKREAIDMGRMKRKLRFQKIIAAGLVVEDYDPDASYLCWLQTSTEFEERALMAMGSKEKLERAHKKYKQKKTRLPEVSGRRSSWQKRLKVQMAKALAPMRELNVLRLMELYPDFGLIF